MLINITLEGVAFLGSLASAILSVVVTPKKTINKFLFMQLFVGFFILYYGLFLFCGVR